MNHFTTAKFWQLYNALPSDVRALANKNYALLSTDPLHPSLHFKDTGRLWSVRIGLHYRAAAYREGEDYFWFWIGPHAEYDKILS